MIESLPDSLSNNEIIGLQLKNNIYKEEFSTIFSNGKNILSELEELKELITQLNPDIMKKIINDIMYNNYYFRIKIEKYINLSLNNDNNKEIILLYLKSIIYIISNEIEEKELNRLYKDVKRMMKSIKIRVYIIKLQNIQFDIQIISLPLYENIPAKLVYGYVDYIVNIHDLPTVNLVDNVHPLMYVKQLSLMIPDSIEEYFKMKTYVY